MSSSQGKVIVITGASSGIGEATARLLAVRGAHVVVGARRTERLEKLVAEITAKGGSARFRAVDVTSRKDTQGLVDFARSEFGCVDVLVNNAGVTPLSPLSALKVEEWDQMIDVNIRGVLHGIAAVLPDMKARGSGQIINVASIGVHHVAPTAAVYCATKYAVWAISDGLRQENIDLRVSVISPGVVQSELAQSPMPARQKPWRTTGASRSHRTPSPAPSRSQSSNRATWTSARSSSAPQRAPTEIGRPQKRQHGHGENCPNIARSIRPDGRHRDGDSNRRRLDKTHGSAVRHGRASN